MKDISGYLEKMEKSILDKLFFTDKIDLCDFDLIVDFGCADGTFIKNLNQIFPKNMYVGYDISKQMIKKANAISCNNIKFTDNFDTLLKRINNKKYAIVFSSVLHELDAKSFETALNLMKNSYAVIIRDMFFDKTKNDNIKYLSIIKQKDKYVDEFENKYGKIDNLLNLYHYFLKYTYTNNWETELNENYFGIDYETIQNVLKNNNFDSVYDEKFTLPYKKQEIFDNFGYNLDLPTHRKLIFKKWVNQ